MTAKSFHDSGLPHAFDPARQTHTRHEVLPEGCLEEHPSNFFDDDQDLEPESDVSMK